jgi:hypothetical protein
MKVSNNRKQKSGQFNTSEEVYDQHTVRKIKQARKQKEFRQVERALRNKDWANIDNELYT